MKHGLISLFILNLLFSAGLTQDQQIEIPLHKPVGKIQEENPDTGKQPAKKTDEDYFPLKKGFSWTYEETHKKKTQTVKFTVEEIKKIEKTDCSHIKVSYNEKNYLDLFYAKTDDGIKLFEKTITIEGATGKNVIDKPSLFIKYPLKKDDKWDYGEFKAENLGEEEIEITAGKFKCFKIRLTNSIRSTMKCNILFEKGAAPSKITLWLAQGAGIVKQEWVNPAPVEHTNDDGHTRTLAKFQKGKDEETVKLEKAIDDFKLSEKESDEKVLWLLEHPGYTIAEYAKQINAHPRWCLFADGRLVYRRPAVEKVEGRLFEYFCVKLSKKEFAETMKKILTDNNAANITTQDLKIKYKGGMMILLADGNSETLRCSFEDLTLSISISMMDMNKMQKIINKEEVRDAGKIDLAEMDLEKFKNIFEVRKIIHGYSSLAEKPVIMDEK